MTALQQASWRLASGTKPGIGWTDNGISVDALELVDAGSGQQHLSAAGTWDENGGGEMRFSARGLAIDPLIANGSAPPRYGGRLDGTATLRGTVDHPLVAADFALTSGRIRRLSFEKFAGHVGSADERFQVDVRLDQGPGVWLTGAGTVPLSVFDESRPAEPLRVVLKSSRVEPGAARRRDRRGSQCRRPDGTRCDGARHQQRSRTSTAGSI